jgi:hypothetical protein
MNYPLSHDCLRRDLIQALLWVNNTHLLVFPEMGIARQHTWPLYKTKLLYIQVSHISNFWTKQFKPFDLASMQSWETA